MQYLSLCVTLYTTPERHLYHPVRQVLSIVLLLTRHVVAPPYLHLMLHHHHFYVAECDFLTLLWHRCNIYRFALHFMWHQRDIVTFMSPDATTFFLTLFWRSCNILLLRVTLFMTPAQHSDIYVVQHCCDIDATFIVSRYTSCDASASQWQLYRPMRQLLNCFDVHATFCCFVLHFMFHQCDILSLPVTVSATSVCHLSHDVICFVTLLFPYATLRRLIPPLWALSMWHFITSRDVFCIMLCIYGYCLICHYCCFMRHVVCHQHDIFVDSCRTLCGTSVSFLSHGAIYPVTVYRLCITLSPQPTLCVIGATFFVATFHQKIHFVPVPCDTFVSTCDTLCDNDVSFYHNFNILWHYFALCDAALSPHSTLYVSSMPYFVTTCHQEIHFSLSYDATFCLYVRHLISQWCDIVTTYHVCCNMFVALSDILSLHVTHYMISTWYFCW
jgi:hypothetical protein